MLKLLKTKFATAFVLAALMFGMFSFTTTPVVAQDTNSNAIMMEEEAMAIRYAVARRLAGLAFVAGAVLVEAVGSLFGAEATAEYPVDSLDHP